MLKYRITYITCTLLFICCSCNKGDRTTYSPHKEPTLYDEIEKTAPIFSRDELKKKHQLIIPIQQNDLSEQIIERKSYICSYNKETRCANWSAWILTKDHANGPYKKKDIHIKGNYLEDGDNLKGKQLLTDWEGDLMGYDHGHLCPSGDNKWDKEAMYQTFYLSNMCVQNSRLNQGPWENLESTCREWAKKFGKIYIVAGPIFKKKPYKTIGNGLHIPDAFFKVVLRLGTDPQAIGFIYNNIEPEDDDKLQNHVKSVDEIEGIVKMDFLPSIKDSIENRIEASADIKEWRVY